LEIPEQELSIFDNRKICYKTVNATYHSVAEARGLGVAPRVYEEYEIKLP
jgi:hypothetical protein